MDAEKLHDAKRVCRPLRRVRIGLASIGGMCGDDARKYAKVMLGLIQEQVGVAAVSNASFSQNGRLADNGIERILVIRILLGEGGLSPS